MDGLILLLCLCIVIWYILKCIVIVPARKMALVERLGLYQRTLMSGLHFLIYPIESLRYTDWTYRNQENRRCHVRDCFVSNDLQQLDIPLIKCFSKETTPITVDVTLMCRITDLAKATYEVGDVLNLFYQAAHQAVRDVCSRYQVEMLQGKDANIAKEIFEATTSAFGATNGVKCFSVLIQDVTLGVEALAARKYLFEQEQARKRKMDELTYQEAVQKREQEMLKRKIEFESSQKTLQQEQYLKPYLENGFTPADIVALKNAEALHKAEKITVFMGNPPSNFLLKE